MISLDCSSEGRWRKGSRRKQATVFYSFLFLYRFFTSPAAIQYSGLFRLAIMQSDVFLIISAVDSDNVLDSWRCEEETVAYQQTLGGNNMGSTSRGCFKSSAIIAILLFLKNLLIHLAFFFSDLHVFFFSCLTRFSSYFSVYSLLTLSICCIFSACLKILVYSTVAHSYTVFKKCT